MHWYHYNPIFLWKFNFTLVRRLNSALIWDISGLWNRSDSRDFREKRIVISRFLSPYGVVCTRTIKIFFLKILIGFLIWLPLHSLKNNNCNDNVWSMLINYSSSDSLVGKIVGSCGLVGSWNSNIFLSWFGFWRIDCIFFV